MTENTVIVFLFTILQGGQEATSIDPMSYPWTESSCLALNPPPTSSSKIELSDVVHTKTHGSLHIQVRYHTTYLHAIS